MKSLLNILAALVLGTLIGSQVYASLVRSSYDQLISELKNATFLEAFLNNDPALSKIAVPDLTSEVYSEEEIKWRLLRNAGILGPEDLSSQVGCQIKSAFLSKTEASDLSNLLQESGLSYVCDVLAIVGNAYEGIQEDSMQSKTVSLMAYSLANYPTALSRFRDSTLERKAVEVEELPNRKYFLSPKGSSLSKSLPITEVINILFTQYGVYYENLENELPQDNCKRGLEEYRQIKELISFILISTNNNSKVLKARSWVTVFEGPMQWGMSVLFFTGLLLLTMRSIFPLIRSILVNKERIAKSTKTKYDLNQAYQWVIATLPVFGFIGTILGLMFALGDADKIPLAQGDFNTSIAISNITELLSTAFTTTLMAFVLGVILSLINLFFSLFEGLETEETSN